MCSLRRDWRVCVNLGDEWKGVGLIKALAFVLNSMTSMIIITHNRTWTADVSRAVITQNETSTLPSWRILLSISWPLIELFPSFISRWLFLWCLLNGRSCGVLNTKIIWGARANLFSRLRGCKVPTQLRSRRAGDASAVSGVVESAWLKGWDPKKRVIIVCFLLEWSRWPVLHRLLLSWVSVISCWRSIIVRLVRICKVGIVHLTILIIKVRASWSTLTRIIITEMVRSVLRWRWPKVLLLLWNIWRRKSLHRSLSWIMLIILWPHHLGRIHIIVMLMRRIPAHHIIKSRIGTWISNCVALMDIAISSIVLLIIWRLLILRAWSRINIGTWCLIIVLMILIKESLHVVQRALFEICGSLTTNKLPTRRSSLKCISLV